ncbi:MAG: hypothetical protein M1269_05315 [Chloroflexi bacterium]|nr:hypothetical protein [Chloroflexota bacterium]
MQDRDLRKKLMILLLILAGVLLSDVSPAFSANNIAPLNQLWKIGLDRNVRETTISKGGEGFVVSLQGILDPEDRTIYINGTMLYIDPNLGKVRWKYTTSHTIDIPEISSDGDHVLAGELFYEFNRDALFFDKSGNLLWKIKDVGECDLSEDGKYILVIPGPSAAIDYVGLFDSKGKLIWKKSESKSGFYACMSFDGRYIMTGTGIVFDRLENIEWKIDELIANIFVGSRGIFSNDSSFFIFPNGEAYDLKGKFLRVYDGNVGIEEYTIMSFNDKYVLRFDKKPPYTI